METIDQDKASKWLQAELEREYSAYLKANREAIASALQEEQAANPKSNKVKPSPFGKKNLKVGDRASVITDSGDLIGRGEITYQSERTEVMFDDDSGGMFPNRFIKSQCEPGQTAASTGCTPASGEGVQKESVDSDEGIADREGIEIKPEQLTKLKQAIKPTSRKDLKKSSINLWHGSSLDSVENILTEGITEGDRGMNAAANVYSASQYPEETGAQALILLKAKTDELDVDPNDQVGDTVEEGLFPRGGHGSACTIGSNEIMAIFDLENSEHPDKIIKLLDKGDIEGAIKVGLIVLHINDNFNSNGKIQKPLVEPSPFEHKSLNVYLTKSEGQPCKQGETTKTGCIPASGEGQKKEPQEKPKSNSPEDVLDFMASHADETGRIRLEKLPHGTGKVVANLIEQKLVNKFGKDTYYITQKPSKQQQEKQRETETRKTEVQPIPGGTASKLRAEINQVDKEYDRFHREIDKLQDKYKSGTWKQSDEGKDWLEENEDRLEKVSARSSQLHRELEAIREVAQTLPVPEHLQSAMQALKEDIKLDRGAAGITSAVNQFRASKYGARVWHHKQTKIGSLQSRENALYDRIFDEHIENLVKSGESSSDPTVQKAVANLRKPHQSTVKPSPFERKSLNDYDSKGIKKGTCKVGQNPKRDGCTPASKESSNKNPESTEKAAPVESTQVSEASKEAVTQLSHYLDAGVGLGTDVHVGSKYPDAKYRSPIEYVKAQGKDYHGSPLPEGVELGTPKECFRNATMLMMEHPDWDYCEGFAMAKGLLPVLHAWCVTKEGKVIDNTFKDPENCAYKGITYPRKQYMSYIFKAKFFGILGGANKNAEKIIANGGLT